MKQEPFGFRDARIKASTIVRYMASSIMSMIPIKRPGIGTMATDCHMRCYYDPEFLTKISLDEAAGVVVHEMMHCLLNHANRAIAHIGGEPDPWARMVWNYAADVVINEVLLEAGLVLPKDCLTREAFLNPKNKQWPKINLPENSSTERIYTILYDKLPQPPTVTVNVCTISAPGAPDVTSGSSADGHQESRPHEDGPPDGENAEGMKPHEQERMRTQAAQEMNEWQKSKGNLPAGFRRFVDGILRPKIDPRKEMAASLRRAVNMQPGHMYSTYRRPNRRHGFSDLKFPSFEVPVPKIGLIIDTSGSMSEKELMMALGVIDEVLKSHRCMDGLKVITGDTRMETCQNVFSVSSVEMAGGGGTSMRQIMLDAVDKYPDLDVLAVVTDGYTDWPEQPLNCKGLAYVTREEPCKEVPKWMSAIHISVE